MASLHLRQNVTNNDRAAFVTDDNIIPIDSILASLRPIQDLTKNWEVDISRCLEDYLQELNEIDLALVSSSKSCETECTLNFSEAALVVQNSSHVYGRKVDFLYKLVYSQLEELSSQRTGTSVGFRNLSKKNKNVQAYLDTFMNHDSNLEFLPLDDALPIECGSTNVRKSTINLACDETTIQTTDYVSSKWQDILPHDASTTKTSLRGVTEIGSLCTSIDLTSTNHSITEARKALVGSLDCTKSLRLAFGACCMTEIGIMMVPGSIANIDDICHKAHSIENFVTQEANDSAVVFETFQDLSCGGNDSVCSQFQHDAVDDPVQMASYCEMNEKNTTGSHGVSGLPKFVDSSCVERDRIGAWSMICPHTRDTCVARTLTVGKTFLLPPGLYSTPSESAKQTRSQDPGRREIPIRHQSVPLARAAVAFDMAMARKRHISDDLDESLLESADKLDPVILPCKGLLFGDEFCYLMERITKQKRVALNSRRKLLIHRSHEEVLQRFSLTEYGGIVEGDDDADHHDDIDIDLSIAHDNMSDNENDGYGDFDINTDTHVADDEKSDLDVSNDEFAALCHAHAQRLHRGAAKFAVETSLNQRVNVWKHKLEPILDEQTDRKPFDIHAYGAGLIERVNDEMNDTEKHIVDFRSISSNSPPYEVCRAFLTSLILCNEGKIVFEQVEERKTPSCSLKLRLSNSG